MFQSLDTMPPDALLQLIKLYAADPRDTKIDLGVGVYRTADGATPVFAAVKEAEQRLCKTQDSKAYLGPEGDLAFCDLLKPYIFGDAADRPMARLQTPGGTGAVRLACEMLRRAGAKRVLLGTPSWPNHAPIVKGAGLEPVGYVHADIATQELDFAALVTAMEQAEAGDVVLLHGCCHNPSGIDYDADQWADIARIIAERGLFPLIDLAYQGLGDGFEEDAAGMRAVLAAVPEAIVAYSCDKNFGVYRDRLGAIYALADEANVDTLNSNLLALARVNWSMPPDHPAAVARIVLEDADLTRIWLAELTDMRARLAEMRAAIAVHQRIGTVDCAAVGRQKGLFSTLALKPDQIMRLREEFGIYMAGSGRINIAGLTATNVPHFIEGLRAVAA